VTLPRAAEPGPTVAPSDVRTAGDEARFTAYVVPHTHWDREWYQPFEVFRARLLDVVDRAVELLECDPRYRRFTLDGQAVVVDDYLELRPEQRDGLEALIRSGKLRVGPWFVLADEFLVSPEALIRNLMHGARACRELGDRMPVAYTPDSFGHIAQLPLLVRGFGLDAIVFERGVGDEGERLRGEFEWQAADGGTSVLAVHLLATYSGATALGHLDWELGDAYDPERAVRQTRAVLFGPGADDPEFPPWLRDAVRRLPGGVTAYATGPEVLLLNGSDHLFPQPNLPEVLDKLGAAIPEVRFQLADVAEFVAAVAAQRGDLQRHQGEFRGSRYHHVLSGVLSSRIYLKQANHRAETLLERAAEPLAAVAALHGAPHPDALLRHAWRTLLLNHPHDSICGCSIDPVHREMMTRFAAVTQLGDEVVRRSVAALADAGDAAHLTVWTPVPYPSWTEVTTTITLPVGEAARLRVRDRDGRDLPHQLEVESRFLPGRSDVRADRVELTVLLPPCPLGLRGVELAFDEAAATVASDAPTPVQVAATATGLRLDNGELALDVDGGGALTLHHLASGSAYPLALRFEDEPDAGDEYDFSPVPGAGVLSIGHPQGPPRVLVDGPVRATLRLSYTLRLPARLGPDRRTPGGEVEVPVTLDLGLAAGAERLDLAVTVANRADDHRLRLRVATGRSVDHVWADGHFHVLRRPVRPPHGEGWYQAPVATSHQRRFVAACDADGGLALLARGLPEYEAIPTPTGVDLAVTLLRCVGWLSRDDLLSRPQGAGPAMATPEAQSHGEHRFELALCPVVGPWWEGPLLAEAERFTASPHAVRGALAADVPVAELTPPLTLSALKRAEAGDGLIVRVWNPAPVPVRGRLTLHQPLHEAFLVRLDETREARLESPGSDIELSMRPSQVQSLELRFAPGPGQHDAVLAAREEGVEPRKRSQSPA
jgi:mannosylglycerate hydrolase